MTAGKYQCQTRLQARSCQACLWTSLWFTFYLMLVLPAVVLSDEQVDYLQQVKPILKARCYSCHGALKQEGGLRLDTAALAIKGGDSGAAIRPGDDTTSVLLERITAADEAERMPPPTDGEALHADQIALIRRWISQGAKIPADEQPESDPASHWAFQPITRPSVPLTGGDWVRNPIDAFLLQRQQQLGLTPQPEAPRIILLRRLYFDLIGLPPTLADIQACEADHSPQWYEQTVKRLLDDPRHGERWARHWMDVWRYSDWWGLGNQLRNSQKHMHHWRDWIVESLNDDTPYDEMIRQMLAADEIYPNDMSKLRATGYLARNFWLFNRPQWMEETVEHVSKGFLGLTMNCSRCHDHKYDPIDQTDYYRIRAFFEPYHVRMDMVPGEVDLTNDGIPRAFDGLLQEPTYRYIRGDERNPDLTEVITPGVPSFLDFEELRIEPVSLPAEAWQPERRPWVLDAYIAAAKQRVTEAESALNASQQKVRAALKDEERIRKQSERIENSTDGDGSEITPLISETFQALDTTRWKLIGGEWSHEPGRLEQKLDGPTRSALRLLEQPPRNFDATIRFTILGGSRWRSVGLSFDVTPDHPDQTTDETEQNIYISAVSGGSKIQAAFRRGEEWHYPGGNAMRPLPIKLNQEYTLRVQVRESLINASLNGDVMIAWETTLPRRDGAFQVITFDAIAIFHEVSIRPLDPKVSLRQPQTVTASSPLSKEMAEKVVTEAKWEQAIAEAKLALTLAELECTKRRAEAQRATWNDAELSQSEKAAAAVRAERSEAVAKCRYQVVVAEQDLSTAPDEKKESAQKSLTEARDALEKAITSSEAEVKPTDEFTKFQGAQWSPTRFLNSGKDDPEITFSPTSTGRRTALARWLTDRRNPLTARVAVNHIWTRHMGQPLVPTVFDFGRKGTPPTHPELLDWLASELIDSGWSMQHLHSLIVNSAAYRMSSSLVHADAPLRLDPENHLWWRRIPIRMESQLVRDSLLSLAGTLDTTMGGPSIPASQQETSTRRSLYFFHSNNERNLFLTTFDEALVKDCYRREQSIVPQQALALSNSQLALDASERIADRLTVDAADDVDFICKSFRLLTGITPNQDETAASLKALHTWQNLPNSNTAAARANLIWCLINHNDFVTLR